jgi:hypothetical protein
LPSPLLHQKYFLFLNFPVVRCSILQEGSPSRSVFAFVLIPLLTQLSSVFEVMLLHHKCYHHYDHYKKNHYCQPRATGDALNVIIFTNRLHHD